LAATSAIIAELSVVFYGTPSATTPSGRIGATTSLSSLLSGVATGSSTFVVFVSFWSGIITFLTQDYHKLLKIARSFLAGTLLFKRKEL
jgi:hypothetical protein